MFPANTPSTPIKGANAERARSANRQAVLGHIQSAGQMGRAEIARTLGLSTQAVSNIIAELAGDGLLVETGTRSVGRGLPAVQYGVNAKGGYALGVEIRPDAVFTVLLDLQGNPVDTRRRSLNTNDPDKVVGKILKMRDKMLSKCNVARKLLMGAGVVMPGPFGQTGLSGLGSDLAGWQQIDALRLFEEALDLPVELSNDANAAAMAERIGGTAQGLTHYAFLYFGAGLGLGVINQGQLVAGTFGNAGEIGHIPVVTKQGNAPLEACLSRVSVQRAIADSAPLNVARLSTLYDAGDPSLMAWLGTASSALSQALGVIENLFDPQTVILGGAMPRPIIDHLVRETRLPELSVSNRPDTQLPRLQRGTCGRLTATMGAASLILNRAFTPHAAAL